MQVKSLLAKAAKCNTQADAYEFLGTLERVFGNARPVVHLPRFNSEACIEDGAVFARFELNQEISDHYITTIRPEVRDGKFVVLVVTNCMLDGKGVMSQSWEPIDGMEDTIDPDGQGTVADLAHRAKELAIANHAQLIQRVGVPRPVAMKAANKSW
jgi:hypothetical protein